jgi:hypothetical protein
LSQLAGYDPPLQLLVVLKAEVEVEELGLELGLELV